MYQISINESISRIIRTKKLTKTLRPTFGLNDHIDKSMSLYQILTLKKDIAQQISDFEPRAKNVTIDILPSANGELETIIRYQTSQSADKNEVRLSL